MSSTTEITDARAIQRLAKATRGERKPIRMGTYQAPPIMPKTHRLLTILATSIATPLIAAETPKEKLERPTTESLGNTATLPEEVVRAESPHIYSVTEAVAATKTNTRLLDTPQAVSVVPRALIEDQGAVTLEEVLRNTAGVTTGGYYSDWDYYRIRGFDAAFTTYWDGLRGDYGKNVELFGVERVEILKGPASSLYGQGPLGGLVNIVSKKPIKDDFADVSLTLGTYSYVEPAIDAGVVLNSAKTVYLRLNALYRDQESFVGFTHKRRVYIAPSITWEIGPDTTWTLLGSYTHDRDKTAFPLPAKGTVLPNINGHIPRNRYVGEPDKPNEVEQWRLRIDSQFSHRFNEVLSLRQNFSYSRIWQDWNHILYPSSLDADERTLYRYPYSLRETLDRFAADTALEAKFQTGPVEHYLVGGVDYYSTESDQDNQQINYADFPGSYPALDLFSPNYGRPLPTALVNATVHTESDWWGVYLQEHAKWEPFTLLLGGRYDWTSSDNSDAEAFTGRVGITYEVVKGVAFYANYSQSFNPQWSYKDAAGNAVEPETGENWEGGVKVELLDGRVSGMVSVFHLTRENVATANLATPDPFDSVVSGEQVSQGVEVESVINFAPGLDLTLAYTFTDAEITEDNTLIVNSRLAGVPEHAFSGWIRYTIQDGPLRGLGFGFGGRYYSAQEGDASYTNPFRLPAYGLLDAAIYYKRGPFYAQINVKNLLDREYYNGAYNDLYVLPGEPLAVRATVGWKF